MGRTIHRGTLALLTLTLLSGSCQHRSDPNLPQGPYLGQPVPGTTAQPFAPGFISTDGWELEGVFAPGMREFYYTTLAGADQVPTVIGYRQDTAGWTRFIEFRRVGEVTFSPDGKRMHMAEGYRDRASDGWTERQSLGAMFDREDWGIMRLSASARGSYVFDDYLSGDVIRYSALVDGVRQAPQPLGPHINTGAFTAHPFIAPDESYLIWDSERPEGYGDSDLYISFRERDGRWGPPQNLGPGVNSPSWEAFGTVTPDGRYLLFNRGMDADNENVDIYWVSTAVIDALRPLHLGEQD